MKISDLKNGRIVETRNGEKYLVVGDAVCNLNGYNYLSSYDENLLIIRSGGLNYSQYDIMKIYECTFDSYVSILDDLTNGADTSSSLILIKERVEAINWEEVKENDPIKIVNKNGDYIIRHFVGLKDGKVEVVLDGKTTYTSNLKNIAENLVVDFSHLELVEK